MMNFEIDRPINQQIALPLSFGVELFMKREDQIHPHVSGNKYRKLKYNLMAASHLGYDTLLTFGGAHSNHIAAVAAAGRLLGFKTIGVIRGEELKDAALHGETLRFAENQGMSFKFVSRSHYREKTSKEFMGSLEEEFGSFYLIPEGGTNDLAIKGCEEILTKADKIFDFICCPVGTGGTVSGLVNCSQPSQQILGFPALKGSFLHEDISKFVNKSNWTLIKGYDFGGYAKINAELIAFLNRFKKYNQTLLDPIYTGKMMFGILELIKKGFFPKGSRILAIHTGGLQGITEMNKKLKQKNQPIIDIT